MHDHGDHHHHPHADGEPHRHPHQPDTEDAPFTYHQVMAEALGEILVEKGVFTADDLRRQIEVQDSVGVRIRDGVADLQKDRQSIE